MAHSGFLANSTSSLFSLSTTSIMMSVAKIVFFITVTVAIVGVALVSSVDIDRSGTWVLPHGAEEIAFTPKNIPIRRSDVSQFYPERYDPYMSPILNKPTREKALIMNDITDRPATRVSRRAVKIGTVPKNIPYHRIDVSRYDEDDFMTPLMTTSGNGVPVPSSTTDTTSTRPIVSKYGSLRKQLPALVKTRGSDDGAASSSSPLRNRNRRSSSEPHTPANNNTTVESKTLVNRGTPRIRLRPHYFYLNYLLNQYLLYGRKINYRLDGEDFYA